MNQVTTFSVPSHQLVDTNEEFEKIFATQPSVTDDDMRELRNLMTRLDTVFEATLRSGIVQLVDAEQTYFQATIDALAIYYMKKY